MDNCDTADATKGGQMQATEQNPSQGEQYWKMRYDKLKEDFDHLQNVNQNLEDKLLNVVDSFEKRHEALMASVEYEKSTLMADVNKLSTKLVDARIKLHDLIEEREQNPTIQQNPSLVSDNLAPPAGAPAIGQPNSNGLLSSKNFYNNQIDPQQAKQMAEDPNLV